MICVRWDIDRAKIKCPVPDQKSPHKQMESLVQGCVCWAKICSLLQSTGWWKDWGTVVALLPMTCFYSILAALQCHCHSLCYSAPVLGGHRLYYLLCFSELSESRTKTCPVWRHEIWNRLCFTVTWDLQQPGGGTAGSAATVNARFRSRELPRTHEHTPWTIFNPFKAFERVHSRSVLRFLVVITFFIRQKKF